MSGLPVSGSGAQTLLWSELRAQLPDHKWRRQMPVGPYFVDFACQASKLIIELDGGQHMASSEHDEIRTRFLAQRGYRVLRFSNDAVVENRPSVLEQVSRALATPFAAPVRSTLPVRREELTCR